MTHKGASKMDLFPHLLGIAVGFFLRDAIIKVIRNSGKQVSRDPAKNKTSF